MIGIPTLWHSLEKNERDFVDQFKHRQFRVPPLAVPFIGEM